MFPVSLALGQGLVQAHMLAGTQAGGQIGEFSWSLPGQDMPSSMSCLWALPSCGCLWGGGPGPALPQAQPVLSLG